MKTGTLVMTDEGEVDLRALPRGPGYYHPRAIAARQKLWAAELEHEDIRIADIIDDPHELERVRRAVLSDNIYLDLVEKCFPRVREVH